MGKWIQLPNFWQGSMTSSPVWKQKFYLKLNLTQPSKQVLENLRNLIKLFLSLSQYSHQHQITHCPVKNQKKILKWREEQKLRLEQKDEEEEKKKKEMKEQASKELEEWYSQHKETIEKTRLSNRNAEKELASQSAEVEPGQEWERIAKLCDFNPKASRNNKDVSRMRSIILQLKQTPPVCANGQ